MNNEFAEERRFADWRVALKSILGFWLVYAATVVARALLGEDPWTVLHNKVPTIIAGTLLTFVLYAILNLYTRGWSMYRKAIAAAVLRPSPRSAKPLSSSSSSRTSNPARKSSECRRARASS